MAGLNITTSMVPRTLLQVLATPDAAVSWKWGVMLPDNIPEPIDGPGDNSISSSSGGFLGAADDFLSSNSLTSSLWNSAKFISKKVSKAVSAVENQVSTAGICLRAESIKIPFEQIQSTTARTQARLRNFPDQINVDSMDITFYEDYNYTTLTYLNKWMRSIVNEYGVFRLPEGEDGYARDIYAYLFDTVGLLKGSVKFEGCYPQQISPIDFGSESTAVKISCNFSVNRISWNPTPLLNLGATGSVGKTVLQGITSGQYGDTIKAGIKGIGSLF